MNKENHERFLNTQIRELESDLKEWTKKALQYEAQADLSHQQFFNERLEHAKTRDWNRVLLWTVVGLSIVVSILIKHNWDQHKTIEQQQTLISKEASL